MAYPPFRETSANLNTNAIANATAATSSTTHTRRTRGSLSPSLDDATFSSLVDRVGFEVNNNYHNTIDNNDNNVRGFGDDPDTDDTDEFGRRIMQQAREHERARRLHDGHDESRNDAGMSGGAGRRRNAFRKARTRPGVLERLERRDISGHGSGSGSVSGQESGSEWSDRVDGYSGKLRGDWMSERARKRRRGGGDDDDALEFRDDGDEGGGGGGGGGGVDASALTAREQKPRDWGRKGRRGNDWLRTIRMNDGVESVLPDEYSSRDQRNNDVKKQSTSGDGYAGDESIMQVDYSALDADAPIPTTEDSPLSKKGSRHTTPQALKLENTSLDKKRQWEMTEELTFGSLITSTPAVPTREQKKNTALDDIRRREIENVKEMAVARSQLNKIKEQLPEEERSKRPSQIRRSKQQQQQQQLRTNGHGSNKEEERQVDDQEKDISKSHVRANNAGPGSTHGQGTSSKKESLDSTSPVMVYKYSQTYSEVDRETQAKAQLKSHSSQLHHRHDSHDLLRRLARATSNSPSPGASSSMTSKEGQRRGKRINNNIQDPLLPEKNGIEHDNDGAPTDKNIKKKSPLGRASTAVASAFKSALSTPVRDMPDYNEQDRDTRRGDPKRDNEKSPKPNANNQIIVAKTPVVTGAWIDTPAPYRKAYLPTPTPDPDTADDAHQHSKEDDENRANPDVRDRKYPRSVLAAILEEAKGAKSSISNALIARGTAEDGVDENEINHEIDHLGDSTIQSLEDLISPLDDPYSGDITQLDEDTMRSLQLPTEPPKTRAEKQRYQELVTLKEMNSRLKSARTSIRDASRSIRRVEQQVETSEDHGVGIDNGTRCSRCGCPGGINGRVIVIKSPWPVIKGLLTTRTHVLTTSLSARKEGQAERRLNLLGWFVVPLLCWYVSEVILSHFYLPPSYAKRMVGYGVDPYSPRPPYVTVTLLGRPFAWLWRPLLSLMKWIVRLCSSTVHEYLVEMGVVGGAGNGNGLSGAGKYGAGAGTDAGAGSWKSVVRETQASYMDAGAEVMNEYEWSMMNDEYI